MNKVCLIAAVAVVAGCAAKQPEPSSGVAESFGAGALQAAVAEPAAVLDIADFTSSTVCEEVTVTGSRMIRGQRCTTTDVDPNVADIQAYQRQWQIDEIKRRSSAEIARQQREALRQSFPTTAGRL